MSLAMIMEEIRRSTPTNLPDHQINNTYVDRVKQTIPNLVKINKGVILDLGCSSGITTAEIAHLYSDCYVVGLDKAFGALQWHNESIKEETLREKYSKAFEDEKYSLVCGMTQSLPFKPETFDAIIDMNNLYHTLGRCLRLEPRSHLNEYLNLTTQRLEDLNKYLKEGGYYIFGGNSLDGYNSAILQKKENKLIVVEKNNKHLDGTIVEFLLSAVNDMIL